MKHSSLFLFISILFMIIKLSNGLNGFEWNRVDGGAGSAASVGDRVSFNWKFNPEVNVRLSIEIIKDGNRYCPYVQTRRVQAPINNDNISGSLTFSCVNSLDSGAYLVLFTDNINKATFSHLFTLDVNGNPSRELEIVEPVGSLAYTGTTMRVQPVLRATDNSLIDPNLIEPYVQVPGCVAANATRGYNEPIPTTLQTGNPGVRFLNLALFGKAGLYQLHYIDLDTCATVSEVNYIRLLPDVGGIVSAFFFYSILTLIAGHYVARRGHDRFFQVTTNSKLNSMSKSNRSRNISFPSKVFSMASQRLKMPNEWFVIPTDNQDPAHLLMKESSSFRQFVKRAVYSVPIIDFGSAFGSPISQYLLFQRGSIILFMILTAVGLFISLPVNISGDRGLFGLSSTASSNVTGKSSQKIFQIFTAIIFTVVSHLYVYFLGKSSKKLELELKQRKPTPSLYSVKLSKVPVFVDRNLIKKHFDEVYGPGSVVGVHIALDTHKLYTLQEKLYYAEFNVRRAGNSIFNNANRTRMITETWYKPWKKVDALEYYQKEIDKLENDIQIIKSQTLRSTGTIFVTFRSIPIAQRIIARARSGYPLEESSSSKELKTKRWIAKLCPEPSDIIWENLHTRKRNRIGLRILWDIGGLFTVTGLNLFSAFLIAMSSNAIIDANNSPDGVVGGFSAQNIINVKYILPVIGVQVAHMGAPWYYYYQGIHEGHHSMTKYRSSLMKKYFVLAIISLVITPILANIYVAENSLKYIGARGDAENSTFFSLWQSLMMSMYIKLVIGYGLGNIVYYFFDVHHLMWKIIHYTLSRIGVYMEYEHEGRRIFRIHEFYAEHLGMLIIGIGVSFFFPIILPFILIYFIAKHLSDRYNIMVGAQPFLTFDNREFLSSKKFIVIIIMLFQILVANLIAPWWSTKFNSSLYDPLDIDFTWNISSILLMITNLFSFLYYLIHNFVRYIPYVHRRVSAKAKKEQEFAALGKESLRSSSNATQEDLWPMYSEGNNLDPSQLKYAYKPPISGEKYKPRLYI